MSADDEYRRALARAYRLLTLRARSEEEMRRSLSRAGFGEECTEATISRLREQGMLNDRTFASEWTRSRVESRPRSKRLIEHELRTRGVSSEDVEAATSELDDEATARQIASRRARLMAGLDRQTCLRRLSRYLLSRGFTGETVAHAVASAMFELEGSKPEDGHGKLVR